MNRSTQSIRRLHQVAVLKHRNRLLLLMRSDLQPIFSCMNDPTAHPSRFRDPSFGMVRSSPKRRPGSGALAPVADYSLGMWSSSDRVSGLYAWPVWGLTGKEGDHVWETRCSELDRLGCDPDSGYAALRFNTRESEMAYDSVRLRDGVLAAPSRSLLCVASLAHLRCAHRLG